MIGWVVGAGALTAVMVTVARSGCGSGARRSPSLYLPNENEAEAVRVVTTKDVLKATMRDEKGNLIWTVRSVASTLRIDKTGAGSAWMVGVGGDLFEGNKVASRFRSEEGKADQDSKVLTLVGGVSVTAEKEGLQLKADKITYKQAAGHIEAEGAVTVSSSEYEIGPFEKLWATPDLTKVGTPDAFHRGVR